MRNTPSFTHRYQPLTQKSGHSVNAQIKRSAISLSISPNLYILPMLKMAERHVTKISIPAIYSSFVLFGSYRVAHLCNFMSYVLFCLRPMSCVDNVTSTSFSRLFILGWLVSHCADKIHWSIT